ncbi:ATP-grasp domain-containing protein [Pseudonocardia sp. DSM 110487]|uniref:ATP-grasp domain-containing protein n=1 Tax=Pseudonocardia sp. DSM 110487 TaxID=2865833 RepID=UPI001C6987AF|nr:ATP-grasp domain-containing protein [Pseudonocardia sp. DSM 110487]QYN32103.1 ATP-grasp domain-containing protein [Pseudonocardia sp. DSM 110487]
MTTVVMLSPGFPAEMAYFTRALASSGARVIGIGDQPPSELPAAARDALAHYEHVSLADEGAVFAALHSLTRHVRFDQVECLWEPYMILAARIRETFGLPGMSVLQTVPFRDKERMKQVLDAAGIRTPRHVSTRTVKGVWEAAERIGYPIIVKPIAGAGSADTYRVDSSAELSEVLPLLRHVPEVSVEEFVDGEEFTFDTVCADGKILFENVMWYRPRPLQMKMHEWVSPVSIALRDLSAPDLQPGREMGAHVLAALGFQTGFTHMEWYRTASGEAVFGEIAARPPGARVVDLMNYATDGDLYVGWAEAVLHGQLRTPLSQRHNAGTIFKRAQGSGRITHIEGLDALRAAYGDDIVLVDLLPIGAPRRDWRALLISDGWVVVRHHELQRVIEMTERFATDLRLYAA